MFFLKKYYDKLILIILLLTFFALLSVEFLSMILEQKKTPEQALNLQPQNPDYQVLDIKKDYSTFENLQTAAKLVSNPQSREENKTSLFLPPELVPCPISEEGRIHFIPVADIKNNKCSFCAKAMDAIDISNFSGTVSAGTDSDGDGIPDADERRLGMNPAQKEDGLQDLDEDGFTNTEEYQARTNMKDPKSRPSYATKLYVKRITKQSLGITILSYDGQSQDPKDWTVQIEVRIWQRRKRRWVKDTSFVKIGDSITSYNRTYTLESIEKDIQFDEQKGINVNKSRLFLVQKGLDIKFVGVPGQEMVDPRQKVYFLLDVQFEHSNDISAYVNENFVVGDKTRRIDTFKVISVDNNLNTVRVQEQKTKRVYEIKSIKDRPQQEGLPPQGEPEGFPMDIRRKQSQAGF